MTAMSLWDRELVSTSCLFLHKIFVCLLSSGTNFCFPYVSRRTSDKTQTSTFKRFSIWQAIWQILLWELQNQNHSTNQLKDIWVLHCMLTASLKNQDRHCRSLHLWNIRISCKWNIYLNRQIVPLALTGAMLMWITVYQQFNNPSLFSILTDLL